MKYNAGPSFLLSAITLLGSLLVSRSLSAQGIAVFQEHCAQCHAGPNPESRAPSREELTQRTPEAVLEAITTGPMEAMARDLTTAQKRTLAEYVVGRPLGSSASGDASSMPNRCAATPMADPTKGPMWNGWGVDLGNTRFQPAFAAGLTAAQVPKLKLKWAFGFPNAGSMFGQPTVAGGRLYASSNTGMVYSLDAATGCVYWSFQAQAGVRTAVTIAAVERSNPARYAIYFGDVKANVYAVDAATGKQIWTKKSDPHPIARITGAPVLYQGRLYVPVASLEEQAGAVSTYECCTFRGSIVAYEAASGTEIWKTYTIPDAPKPVKKTSKGTQLWGAAGAAVWSAPTIDAKRGLMYFATGDAYTAPAAAQSDAIMAIDLKTGRVAWTQQLTPGDAWIVGCPADSKGKDRSESCPEEEGPDFDFAQSPVLCSLPGGRDIIVVGQKSGIGWGLDPGKKGAILWSHRVGKGSINGGMVWGSATDGRLAYFANADGSWGAEQAGGLAAVKIETGEPVWFTRPPPIPCTNGNRDPKCVQAQSAAITAIPGVVFSGATNGIMRAYSADNGSIIWEYNTQQDYKAVNGAPTRGGGINGPGPTVVNGMVYITSGYAALGGGTPGNALLAFGE
jgi:polyvinyl alcohol dehydrogenase (cytochrome)